MHTDTIEGFVKSGKGQSQLVDAVKQQKDLSYFTQSKIQQDVTDEYWKNWAERKYATNDMFLNYVKHVFRPDNAMSFTKFMRFPLPSAELINNRIKESLERVFHADDSFFKYNIRGESFQDIPELNSEKFDKDMFKALLFRYNDILVTTVVDTNTPARQIINIENVIAIDSKDSVIHRLAYTAMFGDEKGYMYMDSMQYAFLNNKFEILATVPHDLGEAPADYIAKEPFGDNDAVRESMFSYVRGDLEEYVFLKTMLKMTEPNGVIPVVTQLDTKDVKAKKDTKGQKSGEPSTANSMGSQKADIASGITPSTNELQTGTTIKIKQRLKEDGSIDSDIVENYFHFYHMPIEPLEYIKGRIKELKTDITISLLGNFSEQNDSAKNEMQVEASFVNKEDKLRSLSIQLSRIKKLSDFKFLALQHGKDNVSTDGFFGSDFFLETQTQLFEMFEKAPNPIERKSILVKTTKNKYRFNEPEKNRTVLLYDLMPFCSDIDFDKALLRNLDAVTFSYQVQFNHWISTFESKFGDIWLFFEALGDLISSEKILIINNLIINLIPKTNGTESTTEG
jgi:hypothetical protein